MQPTAAGLVFFEKTEESMPHSAKRAEDVVLRINDRPPFRRPSTEGYQNVRGRRWPKLT